MSSYSVLLVYFLTPLTGLGKGKKGTGKDAHFDRVACSLQLADLSARLASEPSAAGDAHSGCSLPAYRICGVDTSY